MTRYSLHQTHSNPWRRPPEMERKRSHLERVDEIVDGAKMAVDIFDKYSGVDRKRSHPNVNASVVGYSMGTHNLYK